MTKTLLVTSVKGNEIKVYEYRGNKKMIKKPTLLPNGKANK